MLESLMTASIIRIPRINDEIKGFHKLFELWNQIREIQTIDIDLDFSGCSFLPQNGVAFLGGLLKHIELNGGRYKILKDTLQENVQMNLRQNGFLHAIAPHQFESGWDGNSIPFRHDVSYLDDFTPYLSESWLSKGCISLSQRLKDYIVTNVIEAYVNVFDHSQSPIGVFTCGQYYPQRGELRLALIDFGVGIPYLVRNYLNDPNMTASQALKWAFQTGTSTKPRTAKSTPSGVGLFSLSEFIRLNHGKLEIFSENGYTYVTDKQTFKDLPIAFRGTAVQITIKCDEKEYSLVDEQSDDWYF